MFSLFLGLSNDKNIVHIIGPCLRIFTTKTELPVKIQVILTLNDLIDKSKEKIRTAVPQLQTLYVKAIADPDKEVRTNAAPGLCMSQPPSHPTCFLFSGRIPVTPPIFKSLWFGYPFTDEEDRNS